jgi:hypothetical protein
MGKLFDSFLQAGQLHHFQNGVFFFFLAFVIHKVFRAVREITCGVVFFLVDVVSVYKNLQRIPISYMHGAAKLAWQHNATQLVHAAHYSCCFHK